MIIDAHHHLWRYRTGLIPWLDAATDELDPLRQDYLGADLAKLLKANGVDGSVIIQITNTIEDTQSMIDAAVEHPFIKGIVGWVPLDDPQAAERQLARWADQPKIKGVRHLVLFEQDPDWLVRPNVVRGLTCLAEHGLTFDLTNADEHHLRHVIRIAEWVPHLRIVIDHLGKPQAVRGLWEPWASIMALAAKCPNVHVKLSGFANVVTKPISLATKGQFERYVDHVIEHFGCDRVMMASNWPPSNLAADYDTTWRQTKELIVGLSPAAQAAIQGGTATRFYRLAG